MADVPSEPDELSVDALDAVAGGKDSQPAPKPPPPKKDQHEFLTVVLTDVLIMS